MVALAGVSRASYYRYDPEATGPVRDVDLRDAIQRIALRFPAYGRPRITAELKRQDWDVNHKRVGRILREDNLLCLRKRKFDVTTDSDHGFRVHPNLARNRVLTGVNQLPTVDAFAERQMQPPQLPIPTGAELLLCSMETLTLK